MRRHGLLLMLLFFCQMYGETSQREMERTLRRLEKFAGKIEKMSDVNWNPVYAGLCRKINSYGRAVIPLLLRDVQDKSKDWKYRYMVIDRLIFVEGKTPDDQWLICKVLLEIAEDRNENVELRKNSVDALSRLAGASSLMDDERRREVMKGLIKIAEDEGEALWLRWEVLRDLARFAKPFGDEMHESLLRFAEDRHRDIRAISISTLVIIARLTENETVRDKIKSFLVEEMQVEEDNLVKDQIIFGIKTLKIKEAIPYLLESLKTGKYCHKAVAAELLGMFKVKEAVPLLIEALKEDNRDCMLSGNAAEALGKIGDKRAIKPLIDLLRESKTGTWADAAIALARLNAVEAIGPMMEKFKALKHFDEEIAMALMALNAREAIPLIEERLKEVSHPQAYRGIKEMLEKFKKGEKIEIRR